MPLPRSIIAHRLGAGLGPENSLGACEAALRAGLRSFECDVKLSADGRPFLLHDDTLLRTHGLALRASRLRWRDLQSCAGEPLPTLGELRRLLRSCAEPTWVNLEIKPDEDAGAALQQQWGRSIAACAAELWRDAAEPPVLSSFSIPALQGAAAAAPQLPRAWLCHRPPTHWRGVAQALGVRALHLDADACDPASLAPLRAAGLQLRLFTVNDPACLRQWLGQGADAVFTDILPAADALPA